MVNQSPKPLKTKLGIGVPNVVFGDSLMAQQPILTPSPEMPVHPWLNQPMILLSSVALSCLTNDLLAGYFITYCPSGLSC